MGRVPSGSSTVIVIPRSPHSSLHLSVQVLARFLQIPPLLLSTCCLRGIPRPRWDFCAPFNHHILCATCPCFDPFSTRLNRLSTKTPHTEQTETSPTPPAVPATARTGTAQA
ncbi:unnamed protein product [Mycena citricolor]|uniref:Uncharacterized protein n=1 Tax=Mycena citricolor TaxID=2018698 RepID=A0AAD2Q6C1_9AGAR|nr:unnamed protein product [Mycena citricolor]